MIIYIKTIIIIVIIIEYRTQRGRACPHVAYYHARVKPGTFGLYSPTSDELHLTDGPTRPKPVSQEVRGV